MFSDPPGEISQVETAIFDKGGVTMPQEENKERNKAFKRAWKEEGLSNRQLEDKFDLSPGGVKSFKTRLRKKDPSLYIKPPANKPAIQQTSKVAKYEKVSYYLAPGMAKEIKQLALNQDMDISELVREIVGEYLKKK